MTTITKWRVPPWAWVPVAIAIIAEATSNALRAYGLGSHLQMFTISYSGVTISLAGAVLVLAAIAVSLSQTRAAWVALTPGHLRQRIVSGFAAVLLLAVSISAMASHIMEAQRAKAGGESHDRTAYAVALAEHKAAKGDLDRLGSVRTTDEVRAAMDKAKVPPWAWRDTAQCTKLEGASAETVAACRPILTLRQEMASAIARLDAEAKAKAAAAKIERLSPPAEATVEETLVSRGWAWIMGLAVVFVATFGTVIFAKVDRIAVNSEPSARDSAQTSLPSPELFAGEISGGMPEPKPLPNRPPRGGLPKEIVREIIVAELADGRHYGSQDELAERFGRSKSTISEWLKEWEQDGIIPERTVRGRCKELAA